jgi:tripartite-type tricarboxylate transporter receptor subunit TctC
MEHLAPIILIGTSPNLLVVHPSLPVTSTRDLIALAKRKPGNLDYASSGAGTLSHLTSELFMMQAGINMMHIPYKGGPPSVIDLVAGQVSVTFSSFPALWPQVSAGKLRAVAVTSAKRVALAPGLPTVAETIPGFESSQWWGLFAPAAVPKDIIGRLNAEMREVLVSDDVKKSLAGDAAESLGGSPLDCANFLRNDYEKWRKVIDKARLR